LYDCKVVFVLNINILYKNESFVSHFAPIILFCVGIKL
jgi:hypothetical protein